MTDDTLGGKLLPIWQREQLFFIDYTETYHFDDVEVVQEAIGPDDDVLIRMESSHLLSVYSAIDFEDTA